MTIIFSNMGDVDCQCLLTIWEGIDNANVIEISNGTKEPFGDVMVRINDAIEAENDLFICCGHGLPNGLLNPMRSGDILLFTEKQARLVKAKNSFGMWCYASDFAKANNLPGLFTSMFISNIGEAMFEGIEIEHPQEVNESTVRFCKKVNELIKEGKDVELWKDELLAIMEKGNPLEEFNYGGLYWSDGQQDGEESPSWDDGEDDFQKILNQIARKVSEINQQS